MNARVSVLPAILLVLLPGLSLALGIDIVAPPGSKYFGRQMLWLPNGNLVITDPGFDASSELTDVGAVHLYAPNGARLSTLYGSSTGDQVGTRVDVLASGHFVVSSPFWRNADAGAARAGASTWRSAAATEDAMVGSDNSLIGTQVDDQVSLGTAALPNGHYYVLSGKWADGSIVNAGALTWGNGNGGLTGTIDASNSVIGSSVDEAVGGQAPLWLATGKVALSSPKWDNGAALDAGAIRIVVGDAPSVGRFSTLNSLVGTSTSDQIGSGTVGFILEDYGRMEALPNGNLLVMSPRWDHEDIVDAGAVTWIDGSMGLVGEISSANSLVGGRASNHIGSSRFLGSVVVLKNSNYVVASGMSASASDQHQSVTFGSGDNGVSGIVSSANSLVGNLPYSTFGSSPVVYALANGNYVVLSRYSDPQGTTRQTITWGNGLVGTTGEISAANSLLGAFSAPVALPGGGFVVADPSWDSSTENDVGAVAWFDGAGTVSGPLDESITLHGTTAGDRVGSGGVITLANGHFLVSSPEWQRPDGQQVGAISWRAGDSPLTGTVAPENSVVGDEFRRPGTAVALSNGNYVLTDPGWGTPEASHRGAVTWMDGSVRSTGTPSPESSLLGQIAGHSIGNAGVVPLANGNYLVRSSAPAFSAITWQPGDEAAPAIASASNSLDGQGGSFVGGWDPLAHSDGSFIAFASMVDLRRFIPATGEAPLIGVPSDSNGVGVAVTGSNVSSRQAYDPIHRRWAIPRGYGLAVVIVDATELAGPSFADGFEPTP